MGERGPCRCGHPADDHQVEREWATVSGIAATATGTVIVDPCIHGDCGFWEAA